jgi:glycerate 2-kinase
MRHDLASDLLRRMFEAAVVAADPDACLARHLPNKPRGRCIVVGAGKAAASMARAVERAWPDVRLSGVVVTRYGHSVPTEWITVREASHPVPDAAGEAAAREIMAAARDAGPNDLVLSLISGGGSALMPLPVPPLTLEDKITINKRLLASGLTIAEMNSVRRRLSLIKGGGLARAAGPARLTTLAISDVPGDDPHAIASGPTVHDPSAEADLSYLIPRLGDDLPKAAHDMLRPKRSLSQTVPSDYRLIASPYISLHAAAEVARGAGVTPVHLGDALEGEAREMGVVMAGIASSVAVHNLPVAAPAVLLSGGETTVTVGDRCAGRGGRNTEFLLSLSIALDGHPRIYAIAADTDGIDGTESAAGATIGPDTISRALSLGMMPRRALDDHDSYTVFKNIGDLVETGPTLTNVNDFRAVLIL